jgi:glucose/arabinose dehydrogenase
MKRIGSRFLCFAGLAMASTGCPAEESSPATGPDGAAGDQGAGPGGAAGGAGSATGEGGTGVAGMGGDGTGGATAGSGGTPRMDASVDPPDTGSGDGAVVTGPHFCDLPGSVRYTASGTTVVPGGMGGDTLAYLQLPEGFCAHFFGRVPNTRQMRFAPGGELFVASPTKGTTGGGGGGRSAIVVLPDDNGDGLADTNITFLDGMPATQGILFTNGYFYYQNDTNILRMPYARGDRTPSASEAVANIIIFPSDLHWPKTLDQADDGTIYVGNGGNDGDSCLAGRPFLGGILRLDGTAGGTPVAKGFRNPIAVRCQRGHNLCFASELAKDYSANGEIGGREKIVPIRPGDDWGFPCCYGRDLPESPNQDCSNVVPEDVAFLIGDTPFSFDFEPGKWAAPYAGSLFVPLHGAAGSWKGARVVAVAVDPTTGMPRRGSDLLTSNQGAVTDFATGWDDNMFTHGRPAAITFAPDGRMFLGNDNDGSIVWIAPLDLE